MKYIFLLASLFNLQIICSQSTQVVDISMTNNNINSLALTAKDITQVPSKKELAYNSISSHSTELIHTVKSFENLNDITIPLENEFSNFHLQSYLISRNINLIKKLNQTSKDITHKLNSEEIKRLKYDSRNVRSQE